MGTARRAGTSDPPQPPPGARNDARLDVLASLSWARALSSASESHKLLEAVDHDLHIRQLCQGRGFRALRSELISVEFLARGGHLDLHRSSLAQKLDLLLCSTSADSTPHVLDYCVRLLTVRRIPPPAERLFNCDNASTPSEAQPCTASVTSTSPPHHRGVGPTTRRHAPGTRSSEAVRGGVQPSGVALAGLRGLLRVEL
jgi:hypothetical protein